MISIGNRIKQRRKELKMSGDCLAKKLGVIRNTLSRWETGRRLPDIETLQAIANALDTTLGYLVGAEANADVNNQLKSSEALISIDKLIKIPVYDLHFIDLCKDFPEALGAVSGKDVEMMITTTEIFSTIDDQAPPFAVKMPNLSMRGANMEEGDHIMINPSETIKNGDVALVIYNHVSMIRWVCYKADGNIELQAANPDYKTILVEARFANNPEIFRILGRAVAAITQKDIKNAF